MILRSRGSMLRAAFAVVVGFTVCQVGITVSPKDIETVRVVEGGNIKFECDISSEPGDEVDAVLWFKLDPQNLLHKLNVTQHGPPQDVISSKQEGNHRVYLDLSTHQSTLMVYALKAEDGGDYMCRTRFKSGGRRNAYVRLEIIDAPAITVSSADIEDNFKDANDDLCKQESPHNETEEPDMENSTQPETIINGDVTISSTDAPILGTYKSEDENEDHARSSTETEIVINEVVTVSSTDGPRLGTYRNKEDEDRAISNVCGPPPVINGAQTQLTGNEHAVGTLATYRCEFGYVPQGSGKFQAVCEQDNGAKWINPKVACVPRSCGDPGYVSFGRRIGNLFTFPNKVEFKCDEGYKLQGTGVRYCQASGDWSGRLPTCEQIYCSAPFNPENGRVRYSSLEYGTLLRYECRKGFRLWNHQPRYCSENGTWSNDEPVCIEAVCDLPEAPEHGTVQLLGDPKVMSLAVYYCDEGRTLIGSSTTKCLETGDWTFPAPKCMSSCTVPEVDNGEVGQMEARRTYYVRSSTNFVAYKVGEKIENGRQVTLRCRNGYLPEASTASDGGSSDLEITCENGEWEKLMKCKSASCLGDPPSIDYGTPVVRKRHHGHVIYYSCTKPSRKLKDGHVECRNGEWTGTPPVCSSPSPSRCYIKDLDVDGLRKPQGQYVQNGNGVTVSCVEGYRTSAIVQKIFCEKGQWVVPSEPCIKATPSRCYVEDLHVDGLRIPQGQYVRSGKDITVSCMKGYKISHITQISCKDGQWVVPPELCIKERLAEATPTRSTTNDSSRSILALATTKKPQLPKPNEISEECFCTYDSYDVDLVARREGRTLNFGSKVGKGKSITISCSAEGKALFWRNGLRLSGSANLTCDVCESWLPNINLPGCQDIHEVYPFIELGRKMKLLPKGIVKVKQNEKVILKCECELGYPGWIFPRISRMSVAYPDKRRSDAMYSSLLQVDEVGASEAGRYECYTTDAYGRNYASFLELQIADPETHCPEIDTKDPFPVYTDGLKVGSVAHLFCKDHTKSIIGSDKRTCLENGQWSGKDDQTCIDVTCPDFPPTEGLKISYSNVKKVGSYATFWCEAPGELIGTSQALCLGNGTWDKLPPSCKYVACPKFPETEGLEITYTNEQNVGSIATFYCSAPSTLKGALFTSCLRSGLWSSHQPSCSMPGCPLETIMDALPDMLTPDMSNVTSETLPDGSELPLLCEGSLTLTGNSEIKCSSGKWEHGSAKCERLCRLDTELPPNLIIQPIQESYRLGEFIHLSCPSDHTLVPEVEKIMCMGSYWTDPIPNCKAKGRAAL